MNNNADIDFLRFLAQPGRTPMTLKAALIIMDEARRLYTPEQPEGAIWRGLYFSPEADDALRASNGLITAIKAVRADNPRPAVLGAAAYNYSESGVLSLKDAKDVCEARRTFLRGW